MKFKLRPSPLLWLLPVALLFSVSAFASAKAKGPAGLEELEAFADNFFSAKIAAQHSPGAVFVVVKDGRVRLAKGYGLADVEKKVALSIETPIRVASIAKTFTVIGVLQLVEKGKLSLAEDINTFLTDLKIEQAFPQPITIANLLTHTEGFEERMIGGLARNPGELLSLENYLKWNMPRRILPPGMFITYGNYASVLAGYIVQQVSGLPFSEYMNQNIFQPLGMEHTTFVQPLPPEFVASLASEYLPNEIGRYQFLPILYPNIVPAGGLTTTGNDMGRFMLALLQAGQLDGGRVLSEASIRQMFSQQFTPDPRLPGLTYGLFQQELNGRRVLVRDGDGMGFKSRMVLMPEENLGFFVYNNLADDTIRDELVVEFFDHYYPSAVSIPAPDSTSLKARYDGIYRLIQADRNTFVKIQILFVSQLKVFSDKTGIIAVKPLALGDAYGGFEGISKWVEVEPSFFVRTDGKANLSFGEDSQGKVTFLFSGMGYHGTYVREAWHENPSLQIGLAVFCGLAFISAAVAMIVVWPVAVLFRRLLKMPHRFRPWPAAAAWLLAGLTSALFLFFTFQLYRGLFSVGTLPGVPVSYVFGVNDLLKGALNGFYMPAVLSIGVLVFAVLAWVRKYWNLAGRIFYNLITLSTLIFIVWLEYWNLLGI